MAESLTIACPECDKQFTVPATAVGKKLRCKGCDHAFVIAAPKPAPARAAKAVPKPAAKRPPTAPPSKPAPAPAPKKADDDDDDGKPYQLTDVKLGPRCPNCTSALESEDVVVCLQCGYNLVTRIQAETRAVEHVSGFKIFLWLLPAIIGVLAAIGLIAFDSIFTYQIENWLGAETAADWPGAIKSVKMWLWIFSLFVIFGLGRYAFIRFFFHPMPPEVEVKKKKKI
jgi:DNA-directed RNA polymerase subunit RPC12/RpoP